LGLGIPLLIHLRTNALRREAIAAEKLLRYGVSAAQIAAAPALQLLADRLPVQRVVRCARVLFVLHALSSEDPAAARANETAAGPLINTGKKRMKNPYLIPACLFIAGIVIYTLIHEGAGSVLMGTGLVAAIYVRGKK
jgi:hypothetical protein